IKASDNADPKSSYDDGSKPSSDDGKKDDEDPRKESECKDQEKEDNVNSTNNVNTAGNVNTVSSTVNAAGINEVNVVGGKTSIELPFDPNMPALEDDSIFDFLRDDEDDGAVADINNLDTTIQVSPNPTTRIHKDHPLDQVIGDLQSATQTRKMSKNLEEHGFVSTIQQRTNHKDLQNCLFACFLSQEEPKKVIHALKDPSWIEAMQEELLQFKLQEVWTLVDLPNGKRAIGSKWVFRNKKDERGIVIRNKARLVAQGYTQEEGIDYDEVFAPVARIEAIRLFLAYASFKDFMVYQMDVKSAFFYRKIEEEVYQKKDGIFISQDKYVSEILKKFVFTEVKTASTPMETQKPLLKDEDGEEVDVHMYRSMIGLLMYLTSSRPDIMFIVYEVVYKELDDSLVRAATTASSLEAEQDSVSDLEKTKTTQAKEIVSLKRRVKKLEQKKRSRTHGLKRLYKAGLTARVESPGDEESLALAALKSVKSKVKGDVIEETSVPVSAASTKDKGKGIMVEPEKTLKKKDQISFDDQEAIRLHAKFDEEEILAREKDEANFTTKQKATLFKELLEQRRKHFAAKREEEKRNKPPTKTQQKKTMITYLKNMKAAKIKELMKIIPDEEEVAIDAIPLATKPLTIVDWKIHKEGKKNYYQIIRADGI
ncbi:putative ribonuclease H-like domain-containing protein, partial [Tanacetum coccineum]